VLFTGLAEVWLKLAAELEADHALISALSHSVPELEKQSG
jgi:hypothetical protein